MKRPKLFKRVGPFVVMDRGGRHDFDGKCEDCGKVDELRPYGPNNSNVCFDCMMKDEAGAKKRMQQLMEES